MAGPVPPFPCASLLGEHTDFAYVFVKLRHLCAQLATSPLRSLREGCRNSPVSQVSAARPCVPEAGLPSPRKFLQVLSAPWGSTLLPGLWVVGASPLWRAQPLLGLAEETPSPLPVPQAGVRPWARPLCTCSSHRSPFATACGEGSGA